MLVLVLVLLVLLVSDEVVYRIAICCSCAHTYLFRKFALFRVLLTTLPLFLCITQSLTTLFSGYFSGSDSGSDSNSLQSLVLILFAIRPFRR